MDSRYVCYICPDYNRSNISSDEDESILGNPLEGSWTDEDGNMNLKISRDGQMTVTIPASGEGKDTEVPMTYTMNKECICAFVPIATNAPLYHTYRGAVIFNSY